MLDIEDSVDVFVVNLCICHSNAYRSKSVVIYVSAGSCCHA